MSYADLDGVPSQTAGVSSLLASDWNTYVRDNFDSIKFGHVVVADNTAKSAISAVEGIMVYQSDVDTLFLYTGSAWVPAVDTVSLVDLAVTTGKIAASAVTSAKIADDTIVNADVNSAAAIAYSKLNLATSIVNADVSATAAIAYSKLNLAASITSADIVDNTVVLGDLATALQAFLVPTGTVSAFAGSTAPTGYLLCNGDVVPNGSGTVQSVTTNYAALYAVVGSAYGVAGALPDLRGRTVIGVGTGTELTAVLGVTPAGMAASVTLTGNQSGIQNHDHALTGGVTDAGAIATGGQSVDHSHTTPFVQDSTILRGTGVVFDRVRQAGSTNSGGTSVDHSHTLPAHGHANTFDISDRTAAAIDSHTNIQPSLPLNYIIKY